MSVLSNQLSKESQQTKSLNKSMQTFFVVWIGQAVCFGTGVPGAMEFDIHMSIQACGPQL